MRHYIAASILIGLVLLVCFPGTGIAGMLTDSIDWYGTDGSHASWVVSEWYEQGVSGVYTLTGVSGSYGDMLNLAGYGTGSGVWQGYDDQGYATLTTSWYGGVTIAGLNVASAVATVGDFRGWDYYNVGGSVALTPEPITCVSMGIVAGVLALSRRRKGLKKM